MVRWKSEKARRSDDDHRLGALSAGRVIGPEVLMLDEAGEMSSSAMLRSPG